MNDKTILNFGPYSGFALANVPAYYLIDLYERDICYGDLKRYIEDNMNVLEMELKQLQS